MFSQALLSYRPFFILKEESVIYSPPPSTDRPVLTSQFGVLFTYSPPERVDRKSAGVQENTLAFLVPNPILSVGIIIMLRR
jgi:hypothetical protein